MCKNIFHKRVDISAIITNSHHHGRKEAKDSEEGSKESRKEAKGCKEAIVLCNKKKSPPQVEIFSCYRGLVQRVLSR